MGRRSESRGVQDHLHWHFTLFRDADARSKKNPQIPEFIQ